MDNQIALSVQNSLIKRHKTVAFAESCTGGYLSHLITSNAGSSKCFLGSFVTYSNELKEAILRVKKETLSVYGAVSKETVEEMILGIFAITEADFAVSISGIAGPEDGTEKNPIGTVWISVGQRGTLSYSERYHFSGSRLEIISQSAVRALFLLNRLLNP